MTLADPPSAPQWTQPPLAADALARLERAVRDDPDDPATLAALRQFTRDDVELRCAVLARLLVLLPNHHGLLRQHAQALTDAERLPEARQALTRLVAMQPADPWAHVELGRLAVAMGEPEAALAHFQTALVGAPANAAALWELAQIQDWRLPPERLRDIESLSRSERDPKALAGLHATLARCLDRNGQFAQAARHVATANTLLAALTPPGERYEPAEHAREIGAAARDWTPALMTRLRTAGNRDRRPLFVLGLPRSGTTLVERMLAAHPAVVGVGEQPLAIASLRRALEASGGHPDALAADAVEAAATWHLQALAARAQRLGLDAGATLIVDKMPDNYRLAGWLRVAFPRAIIVHCLRDPRDVALSCWMTQFAGVPWAHSLEHITHRIEQHRVLMRHWRPLLGEGFVELRYENLVADPEAQLRRLLAATGLDWDAGIMGFAHNKGFVASASRQQVREGIHARSVGRWQHYAASLQPVLPRLEAIVAQDAREATADLKL